MAETARLMKEFADSYTNEKETDELWDELNNMVN